MSTADISGAEDGLSTPDLPHSRRNDPPVPEKRLKLLPKFHLPHSARLAVALIAGLCAAFVATDTLIAELSAVERAGLATRLVSAALATADADTAAAVMAPVARALGPEISIAVTDRDGAALFAQAGPGPLPLVSDVTATQSIVGPLGAATTGLSQTAILVPVGLRALLALALAGFCAVWAVRRSSRAGEQHRAQALNAALAITTDGVIVWDGRHMLAAASDALHKSAPLAPALIRQGLAYGRFLDGLRKAGDLTLVSSARTERRLRLVLPGDEIWDMYETLTEDGLLVTRLTDVSDRARLRAEVARLRTRIGEMADEVQNQRVRGDAASRSKTLFLGQLSHSIRTPLNHIIGFADLLRHQSYGPLGDGRYLGYAANIKQSGEALLDMLANMLELAEFESGHRVLAKEPIRMAELLDWTEGRYAEQAQRAGVRLIVERGDDRLLTGDRLCLKRLIGNIVDNSLKFTPSGGSLTIAAWPTDDGIVLEFTDTGIGIAPDTLTILNTSFALGSESNGNGIAIARAIAELSGGQLQVSSSPGIGTTVAVVLPTKPTRVANGRIRQVA
ncbi:MAG: HAMP domain-containing histidine kinase [Alphaproteobacteria bacterium]|nr:HAMP domain-containing histidine kinase [Alphaproteobacteria bacterium]